MNRKGVTHTHAHTDIHYLIVRRKSGNVTTWMNLDIMLSVIVRKIQLNYGIIYI